MRSQKDAIDILKKFSDYCIKNTNPQFILFPYNPMVDPMVAMNNHISMMFYNQYGYAPPVNNLTNQMGNMNLYSK